MRIVMAGSSGLLGSSLRESLARDGHDVVRLVRRPPRDDRERQWDPHTGFLETSVLEGADVVVNLAGAGVVHRRMTASYKQTLISSRLRPTSTLAKAIASLPADAAAAAAGQRLRGRLLRQHRRRGRR